MKVKKIGDAKKFTNLPNVGPRVAQDFETLGFTKPSQLKGKDPYRLYVNLCKITKVRHDPCLLDVFISVSEFTKGAPPTPWWYYTPHRKKKYPVLYTHSN